MKTLATNNISLLTKRHSKFYFHLHFVKAIYDSLSKKSSAFCWLQAQEYTKEAQLEQDQILGAWVRLEKYLSNLKLNVDWLEQLKMTTCQKHAVLLGVTGTF